MITIIISIIIIVTIIIFLLCFQIELCVLSSRKRQWLFVKSTRPDQAADLLVDFEDRLH